MSSQLAPKHPRSLHTQATAIPTDANEHKPLLRESLLRLVPSCVAFPFVPPKYPVLRKANSIVNGVVGDVGGWEVAMQKKSP